MRKIALLLTIFMFVLSQAVSAQTRTVTGNVTSADDGSTLPGVSIVVKGTSIGTVSDIDGEYSINVPNDAETLVFSFVGMDTKEVAITGNTINVELGSSSLSVDEVIVVAYGESTKESFTGSVDVVTAEKIETKNVSNVSQALAGEAAGVNVINNNGQPGSTADIRIRGIGSINGSRSPLYVVDGVPLQGDLNSINPGDIESTTILKDASATAIYGSRGANGVILITTKKGKEGESLIEADVKYGINMKMLPDYDVFESPERYTETAWSALKTRGMLSGEADPAAYANNTIFDGSVGIDPYYNLWDVDGTQLFNENGQIVNNASRRYEPELWRDEMFQQANRTEANVKLSGGQDKTKFYTSFGFLDDQGYYINSDYQRFTARSNISHELRDWLKGSTNMSYMNSVSNFSGGQEEDSNNGFWFVANMPPIYPVYARGKNGDMVRDEVLNINRYDFGDGTYGTRRFASLTNAVANSTLDVVRQTRNQVSGNTYLEATFLKDFTLSTRFGVEYLNSAYDNLGNAFYGGSAEQGGSIYKVKENYFAYTTTNMLSYDKQFGDHNISAFIAQEASYYKYQWMSSFKSNLADPFSLELDNAVVSSPSSSYAIEQVLASYFGQVKYDFNEKYFFQGVIRRDGSSKFVNEKWGNFGSAGFAWMLSKEDFMAGTSGIIDELKLKASYGIIGEQGGIGAYSGYDLYSVNNLDDNISLQFDEKGNPDLTWEQAGMFQVGTEFLLFDRISGSVDYYNKSTENLLIDRRVNPSLGYAIIQVNDGTMINSGVEVLLDAEIVKSNDFNINFGINAAFEHNEITNMPIDPSTGEQKVINVDGRYGLAVGHSIFDFYAPEYVGVDADNGAAQWNRYYNEVDGNKEYIQDMELYLAENEDNIGTIGKEITNDYSVATNKYVEKSAIPKVRGSFNLDADYKGFALTALFSYSLGGYGYDANYADLMHDDRIGGNNWHKDIANAWKNPGDETDVPAITGQLNTGEINYAQANRYSTRFITSTNYLALNNLSLSYSFNESLLESINIKGLKLYVSADNLWVASAREGFYPNTSEVGASERYLYVPLTSITGGIKVKF
ncbi:MAG TPA: SusC/RagA family TonB-linked outer membrane protein [Bacteroidales bacterium]|nr:SusC/RagA family TonB-linked outer membrane protein [Bacteroidales bacterium]